MPKKAKRAGEKLDKDLYDARAGEDDRFAEVPDPGRGMTKASSEVMQRRKIIKVSRRKFGGGGGAPSAPVPAPQPASTNPFAATTLAPPKAVPANKENGGKANPFGNIALAASAAPAKPMFSFGASPAPAPAAAAGPKPAAPAFSFGSKTAAPSSTAQPATTMAAPNPAAFSTPKPAKGKKSERTKQLNEMLLQTIVDHWEGGHYFQDYSSFLEEYQAHAEKLEADLEGEVAGNAAAAPAAASGSGAAPSTNGNSQLAKATFSFGAPAPAPAAKPFSMAAPMAPPPSTGTAFSFSTKPAAAPAFSFGAPSSSSLSAPSTDAGANDDDPTSNPDDGKIETIEHEENTEEEILHEVRAKHIKLESGAWKKYGAGVLRLYKHKTTAKQRMIIRNQIGKVQFCVGVSKGMKFEKEIKTSKKGKAAYIKFAAVEDASKGVESFMLQVKPECVDKLHEKLELMVA
ncbi:hypothetical protein ACHAXT_003022 [Thalassiosira profunda]